MQARRALLGVLLSLTIAVGGYYTADWITRPSVKLKAVNSPTFPPLPTVYWDHSLATEGFSTARYAAIHQTLTATDPSYFVSVVDRKTPIAYRKFVIDHGNERGAVVISSGRTESMLIYEELIGDFNRQGYSVYIHDHRGQGLSGRLLAGEANLHKSHVVTFDDYVTDMKTFVDQVVKPDRRGHNNKLFLVAHSMGGAIASLYLERYQNDFYAAVLVTPMHAPRMPAFAVQGAKVLRLIRPDGYALGQVGYEPPAFVDVRSDLTHSRTRLERMRRAYAAAAATGRHDPRLGGPTHGWLAAANEAAKAAVANAARVKVPVLILQASDDTAVNNAEQREFCNRVPAGNCRGFVLEKSFHAVFNEADTYRVPALTKIFDFFARGHREV